MNTNLTEQFSLLKNKLEKSQKILITMSAPDGDAIGAALALYNEFKKLGKEAIVQSSFEIPKYLKFAPLISHIVIGDVGQLDLPSYDMVIMVDAGDPKRVIKYSQYPDGWRFPEGTFIVVFDHHATEVAKFADIEIVNSKSASTCQLIYQFFEFTKIDFEPTTATLLYIGMFTDTGGFIHSNATAEVYKIAGEVLEKGADKDDVILHLEKTQSLGSMILSAEILKNIELVKEDEFSYVIARLDNDLANQYESDIIEDTMNILKSKPGFIRNVDGTAFGITASQNKDIVSVSFRARTENFDLAKICERFGGGGHKNACAFKTKGQLEDVIDTLKEQIRSMLSTW